MKKLYSLFTIMFVLFAGPSVLAQQIGDLKGIHFQAVAIDDQGKEIVGMDIEGKPLYNKTIGVRFSILSGDSGPVLYQETHTTLTDQHGLFSLVIGQGELTGAGQYATLMELPWIEANQFLKVEISIKNDGDYKLVSLQQFMAVPYSFYTDDIADNAITTAKILDEEILSEDIKNEVILSEDIKDESIVNADIANGTVDLTAKVTNVLPVANGGTGAATLTNSGILLGGGNTPVRALPAATDLQIPVGVTGADPKLLTLTQGTGIIIEEDANRNLVISSGVKGVNTQETSAVTVGTIAAGTNFVVQVTLEGVALGDFVVASFSNPLQGCLMSGYVRNNNQIEVAIFNGNATQKNLGSGTFKVLVIK
ncbi:hypothetical protein [Nafulsella turpanensis]|uniref:hypothetical protein n=1 Tax=Nafulsella turpanensis TaxID=1265690 RepID=UPI000368FDA3|nr:hypothetical protein [Nafulsella turpanensis]